MADRSTHACIVISGPGGGADRPEQERREMRGIAGLGICLALAAGLGTAVQRELRLLVLLVAARNRLRGVRGFARRPCLTDRPRFACGPCFSSRFCIRRRRCLGGVSRLARLVAALAVATALRLAASAAGTFTIAAARFARTVALLA